MAENATVYTGNKHNIIDFYILSCWNLLCLRHDEGNDICHRDTSGLHEGGAF